MEKKEKKNSKKLHKLAQSNNDLVIALSMPISNGSGSNLIPTHNHVKGMVRINSKVI